MTGEMDPYDETPLCGQVDSLREELEGQRKLSDDSLNRLKYLQADFDNYRKQFDRQKISITEHANESLITDMLVIIDDLDRAVPTLSLERDREGISLIAKRMTKILAGHGLQPIESVGKKFDPRYHEVLCTEASDDDDGTILEEFVKGYLLKSKVIRSAKVKVARNSAEDTGEENG